MDCKYIVILLVLTFIGIFINRLFLKNKSINIILIILVLCSNYNLNMHYAEYSINETRYLMLPFTAIIIIAIFLSTLNYHSWKISLDNIILIIILSDIYISYNNERIYTYVNFIQMLVLYLTIFFIGYIYKNIKNYNYNYTKIIDFFSYVAIFNFLLSIMQFITEKKLLPGVFDQSIIYSEGASAVKRVVGIAGTNNSGGNLSAILFSIVLFNYLKSRKKVHLIALVCNLLFSILTLTRIGYLAIAVEVLIFFILTKWDTVEKIRNKVSIMFLGCLSTIIVICLWGYKIYDILIIKRGNTGAARIIQFNKIFEIIKYDNNFTKGVGIGQYKDYMYYYNGYWDIDIHSQYLNVLVEQGIVIFILFICFNIYIFIKAYKNCSNRLEKSFILSLFIANLICSNYNPNQYYYVNNVLYYLLIYCFIYKNNEKNRSIIWYRKTNKERV